MTVDELRALVARITYKPNCRIYVEDGTDKLRVALHVEDSFAPKKGYIHISLSYPNPVCYLNTWREEDALKWILGCVDDAERHETREWLKLDGVAIFDPHKEKT